MDDTEGQRLVLVKRGHSEAIFRSINEDSADLLLLDCKKIAVDNIFLNGDLLRILYTLKSSFLGEVRISSSSDIGCLYPYPYILMPSKHSSRPVPSLNNA